MAVISKICIKQIHKDWYSIEQNFLESLEREVNLNADQKRFWLDNIENLGSNKMNESVPISLDHFKKGN
jgi:hypothetical protein